MVAADADAGEASEGVPAAAGAALDRNSSHLSADQFASTAPTTAPLEERRKMRESAEYAREWSERWLRENYSVYGVQSDDAAASETKEAPDAE